MRVVAGKYGGRALQGPKHKGLRPTADRVKEALFSIIGVEIVDGDFLDLFAGTGAIGIEALSRGANQVIFCDFNPQSIRLLRRNLELFPTESQVRVLEMRADKAIARLSGESVQFDLIFLDPPFDAGLLEKSILQIRKTSLVKSGGLIIAEHPYPISLDGLENGYPIESSRKYGDIGLTFFRNEFVI